MPDQTGVPAASVDRTLTDTDTAAGGINRAFKQFLDNAATLDARYDLAVMVEGKPTATQKVGLFVCPRALVLKITPASGSHRAVADVAATGTATLTMYKNGVSVGTITFTTSATGVVSVTSDTSFVAGDKFRIDAPGTVDSTLADLYVTLVFEGA